MSRQHTATRRTALKLTGAALATGVGASGLAAASGDSSDDEWTVRDAGVDVTLSDVEATTAGVYAVGGAGVVVERTPRGWRTILRGGPTGNGNALYGSDVTDDGERLWFAGSSGSIGELDVRTGGLNDHSAPMDVTNNFNDVAVTGPAGEANVFVAGDSGKIYYSFENGAPGTWDDVTPGSGSNLNAIDFHGVRSGHAVDGNKTVFETADGSTYGKIGIADANANFYGVDSDAPDDVWVAGGGGGVHHWTGARWLRDDVGDATLRDVEVAGDDGIAVGSSGAVAVRGDEGWHQTPSPTGQNLKAVVSSDVTVAVGAGGTVIER